MRSHTVDKEVGAKIFASISHHFFDILCRDPDIVSQASAWMTWPSQWPIARQLLCAAEYIHKEAGSYVAVPFSQEK